MSRINHLLQDVLWLVIVDQEPLAQKECLQIPEFEWNLDMMLSRKGMSPCKISEVCDLLFNVFPLTVGISLVQVILLGQSRYALLQNKIMQLDDADDDIPDISTWKASSNS